jgi:hypothetical protein
MQHCTFSELKEKVSYGKISRILALNSKPYLAGRFDMKLIAF